MVLSSLTDHALSLRIIASATSQYNAGRVEDFLTKFADHHWRVKAKRFLVPGAGVKSIFRKRARGDAMPI